MALNSCEKKQVRYSGDTQKQWEIPVVDLGGRREELVERVKMAATTVGFFQVVNHAVPESLMKTMLNMSYEFHQLPEEEKLKYNTENPLSPGVTFAMNYAKNRGGEGLSQFTTLIDSEPIDPNQLPEVCRSAMLEYSQHVKQLVTLFLEMLSETLGLKTDHLVEMGCAKGHVLVLNYYAKTDIPNPTVRFLKHADRSFLTVLLQDLSGGLQVLYQNQWLNVPPVSGALIVNVGDLLKLVSNDAFTSSEHRVWSNTTKTRTSVACLFYGDKSPSKMYGPIKELVSENSPPLYREITIKDYIVSSRPRGYDGSSTLTPLKL